MKPFRDSWTGGRTVPQLLTVLREGPLERVVAQLLSLWRETRNPAVADLLGEVSQRVALTLQNDRLDAVRRDRARWFACAAKGRAADIPLLLASLQLRHGDASKAAAAALGACPPDPRIGRWLLARVHGFVDMTYEAGMVGACLQAMHAHRDAQIDRAVQRLAIPPQVHAHARRPFAQTTPVEPVDIEPLERAAARWRLPDPDREPLLAQVFAEPDDDLPRRMYADQLMDRGDPWGELINLQLLPTGERTLSVRARMDEIVASQGSLWVGPLRDYVTDVRFERGFAVSASVEGSHVPDSAWWRTYRALQLPICHYSVRELNKDRYPAHLKIPALVASTQCQHLVQIAEASHLVVEALARGDSRVQTLGVELSPAYRERSLEAFLDRRICDEGALSSIRCVQVRTWRERHLGAWLLALFSRAELVQVTAPKGQSGYWKRAIRRVSNAEIVVQAEEGPIPRIY